MSLTITRKNTVKTRCSQATFFIFCKINKNLLAGEIIHPAAGYFSIFLMQGNYVIPFDQFMPVRASSRMLASNAASNASSPLKPDASTFSICSNIRL